MNVITPLVKENKRIKKKKNTHKKNRSNDHTLLNCNFHIFHTILDYKSWLMLLQFANIYISLAQSQKFEICENIFFFFLGEGADMGCFITYHKTVSSLYFRNISMFNSFKLCLDFIMTFSSPWKQIMLYITSQDSRKEKKLSLQCAVAQCMVTRVNEVGGQTILSDLFQNIIQGMN